MAENVEMAEVNRYPKSLVDQYLKICFKLRKVENAMFKRFGPNVTIVSEDFTQLSSKFAEFGIYPYAAMCQLGVVKCETYNNSPLAIYQALIKAARYFLQADDNLRALLFKSTRNEFREAALQCYSQAIDKCPDDSVMKAAVIREMTELQIQFEGTSTFNSPAHRIGDLELSANRCMDTRDYLLALQQLDDIVDNIYERKKPQFYQDLLKRVEISRILLMIALSLPPARQTPAHIKLIEYYVQLAEYRTDEPLQSNEAQRTHSTACVWQPGQYLALKLKMILAEIVLSWHQQQRANLQIFLKELHYTYPSLTAAQQKLIDFIIDQPKNYS